MSTERLGMIARLIDVSARKRLVVFGVAAALALWGVWSAQRSQFDALPDLSDTQVIVATEWMGRSPTLIEDQITYPITTTFLGAPRIKTVRGLSMFGMSFVYVVFKDGTDLYWARSRVVEYLAKIQGQLPEGVTPQIGPDATSVGWVFQYALVDKTGQTSLQERRAFQDWHLRYWLQGLDGVAEVASIGGFEKQYQIQIDPARMKARNVSVGQIAAAVRGANVEVGGRVIEMAQHEYVLRGRGYVEDRHDLELAVVTTDARGTPIRIRDVAEVVIGGNLRRGVADLDGEGETVGGIVIMRSGENALDVIARVKAKLAETKRSLPPGVEVVPVYDRSELIKHSVRTLSVNLLQILAVVVIVIFAFLFHLRSALVAAITLPTAAAATFVTFYYLGISINIMSLAGVILALGDMVDSACVLVENAHRKIEQAEREGSKANRTEIVIRSARELGPSMFGALLVLTIAFLPVFALQGEEGRLFRPLALAKTFSMAFASLFAVTLVPALMVTLLRGKILPERKNPINRICIALYRPLLRWSLRARHVLIVLAVGAVIATIYPFTRLGSEFMPPLYEEDLLYMPITVPGISVEEAKRLLQWQDQQIRQVPEVERVFGKAGRAETSLDPAPLSMFETIVHLKPRDRWREGATIESITAELERVTRTPGVQGAWTMPIKARIDMLSTGIRTPIGIKVFGKDLGEMEKMAKEIEAVVKAVPGTTSAFAERITGGFYLNIEPDREQLARYGLAVGDLQDVIGTALGGEMVTTTVEGRERFGVTIRYPRELRSDPQQIAREVLIPTMDGAMIPLGQLAKVVVAKGAPSIRTENALLSAYIYVDIRDRDIGSYVADAKKAVAEQVKFPPGYYVTWSGQFEYMERAIEKMKIVIPVTLLIIFLLLYLNFKRLTETLIVMLSVPFALVGGVWLMWLLGYNLSVAVAVGFIALAGVAAETGVIMLIYLDHAWEELKAKRRTENQAPTLHDLYEAIMEGAVERVRPKMMTVVAIMAGLLPIMWGTGTGSEVMSRIAAPMVGGMISSTVLTLAVIPAIYALVKQWRMKRGMEQ